MRDYEIVYILDPDLSEEAVAGLMERFRALADSQGAEIASQERWEKRRLAYEIKDKREGIYVVMELKASPGAVHEMDRILKITDGVLRHLIVRVEEGKRTSVRDLRTPQPVAAAAPATAPEQAAEASVAAPVATEAAGGVTTPEAGATEAAPTETGEVSAEQAGESVAAPIAAETVPAEVEPAPAEAAASETATPETVPA